MYIARSVIDRDPILRGLNHAVFVYEAVKNGEDFVIVDLNEIAESVESVNKNEIIGRHISEVFPEVKEFCMLDILKRVWQTSIPEHQEAKKYTDRIQ